MRTALVVVALGWGAVAAAGNRVVVMNAPHDVPDALQIALADRHIEVEVAPGAPEGAQYLDRAEAARRAAVAGSAEASMWIDGGELCVVSADGRELRHAPLPPDASARASAAIAASLLDELIGPPETAGVDVHFDVTMPPSAIAPRVAAAPVIAVQAAPEVDPIAGRWRQFLIELGSTATPASYGLEAELAVPVTDHVRVGLIGGYNKLFDGFGPYMTDTRLYDVAAEVRYSTSGALHLDIGLAGGVMTGTTNDWYGSSDNPMWYRRTVTAGFAAVRIAAVREYQHAGVELAVEPMMLLDLYGNGDGSAPAIMTSLRVELPL